MIITDSSDFAQAHMWVRCTCDQTLEDGRRVIKGHRYFSTWPWDSTECGPCANHPDCDAGALSLLGLDPGEGSELFCAANFEPVDGEEAAELMQAILDVGVAFGERAGA